MKHAEIDVLRSMATPLVGGGCGGENLDFDLGLGLVVTEPLHKNTPLCKGTYIDLDDDDDDEEIF